jgi:hypothetical protein
MSYLSEIVTKITSLTGDVFQATLFQLELPNEPDACVVVKDGPGQGATMGFGAQGVKWETPSLSVVVRGARPGEGIAAEVTTPIDKIETIYRGLTLCSVTLGTTYYHWITPQGKPAYVGRDADRRRLWSVNFLVRREPS